MDTPTTTPVPPTFKPMTLALAGLGLALTAVVPLLFAQLPPAFQVWNLSVIGALALFAAARLGFWPGVAFVAVAIVLKDLCVYFTTSWWEPYPLSWVYFTVYVLIGWAVLRRSVSSGRVAVTALGTSMGFFFVSNFVSWLEQAQPYGYSLQGLMDCYAAGIPFFRGTLLGDIAFSGALFGAHLALSRAYFPNERVGAVPAQLQETEENW